MLTEGMYIADRYEIIGKIGAGGMSDVYKAKDLTLGRFVAIKVLKPEFSEDLNFCDKSSARRHSLPRIRTSEYRKYLRCRKRKRNALYRDGVCGRHHVKDIY